MLFAAHYEGEMGKLPHDATDMQRDLKHRALLGITDEPENVPADYVDVFDLIGFD